MSCEEDLEVRFFHAELVLNTVLLLSWKRAIVSCVLDLLVGIGTLQ